MTWISHFSWKTVNEMKPSFRVFCLQTPWSSWKSCDVETAVFWTVFARHLSFLSLNIIRLSGATCARLYNGREIPITDDVISLCHVSQRVPPDGLATKMTGGITNHWSMNRAWSSSLKRRNFLYMKFDSKGFLPKCGRVQCVLMLYCFVTDRESNPQHPHRQTETHTLPATFAFQSSDAAERESLRF